MAPETIHVEGRQIAVSHLDKVLFPCGITKGDVIAYYQRIAPFMLPYCRDRALTMERYPDGIGQEGFFQKHIPDYFPDWIRRTELAKEGGSVTHAVATDAATLVYLANQACITTHLALARVDKPNFPDRIVVDLDPSDEDFAKVQEAASHVSKALEARGIRSFVQTTGSRGLHVLIPLARKAPFVEVRGWVKTLASELAAKAPTLMTLELRKSERGDKVFLDLARNAYGQTAVAPFALRARPEAPIATPLTWKEALASGMHARRYALHNIFRRLARIGDSWDGFFDPKTSFSL